MSFLDKAGITQVLPSHEAGSVFQIHGETSQVVHIPLGPDQKVQCEPGTMVYCVSKLICFKKLFLTYLELKSVK